MTSYAFRLLNVFASTTFSGNQLCVFEDARGMDDATMLNLAAQFNLSETTFILPSDKADARVRIFTPGYEMKFAGHPTIGTSQVVRELRQTGDALTLEFAAGIVPVQAQGDAWTFTAPCPGGVQTATPELGRAEIAALVGLSADDLAADPIWVDTGADQLLVPLASVDAVRRAAPDASKLSRWQASSLGRKTLYVFAFDEGNVRDARQVVVARYFFAKAGGGVDEDAGTGSACANLGGWLIHQQRSLPVSILVEQGDQMGRPCRLLLDVLADGRIQVGGRALEIGRGTISI
ncbi:Trans-2,3-dihydro-3-hydroxyanthranilate isomerase [Achromobacter spanius]|uniref:PhzF family phenazine biosynthesis protein n=1 Tax=Achromobacter spanius TaxID=217203 RepID=UPI000C2BEC2E|nr:PhzF family phenazine biosynthesis protein [Achromobacter spanius]AUA59445.1 phenazine biosynthesis protein PhzC/PhzF [Achromobacter spanius]CAB3686184.1 Trans-2,3-dihydro-3-hydroxyanthranilate isomerase [Achromobacter spanius]SPT40094.1 Trans-2,3-dihydro-3-hydroxyanthranilate isomerase [Achromobacter denitrificans]VEE58334.1 Trans-2,3-dihydro-3-hydroxyanthranilate isomerase [Achromobacter spanius]